MLMSENHIGSDFDDFLQEEGIFEEVEAAAIKKVVGLLKIAEDLIARSTKLSPSTRLMREKIIARIRCNNELPVFQSIGYWRNYIASLQLQVAELSKPLMDLAREGDEDAIQQIQRGITLLREAEKSRPPEGERKRRVGRVTNLSKVREGWQEIIYSSLGDKWKPAFAVMALTGCRPGELNGLEIRPTDQKGILWFRIKGKKVTEDAGQAWRELRIDVRGAAGAVELIAKIGPDGWTVEIKDSAQAITKAIARAAQRTKLIRLDQTLPACTCRNAVASGMKAAGSPIDEIAAALGHSTDECQKFNGRARAGHKAGGGIILEVRTAHPVKKTGLAYHN